MIIFLSNFGPPLVLILAAITTVRLFVLWASGRTRLAVSPRRWLIGWGAVGFAVSAVLGLIAWRMDNDFIAVVYSRHRERAGLSTGSFSVSCLPSQKGI
jgi:hypothetical protein